MSLMKCPSCGGRISEKARVCPICGNSVESQIPNNNIFEEVKANIANYSSQEEKTLYYRKPEHANDNGNKNNSWLAIICTLGGIGIIFVLVALGTTPILSDSDSIESEQPSTQLESLYESNEDSKSDKSIELEKVSDVKSSDIDEIHNTEELRNKLINYVILDSNSVENGIIDAEVDSETDIEITFRVFDDSANTTSNTIGFYSINRKTCIATNVLGEEIDLSQYSSEPMTPFEMGYSLNIDSESMEYSNGEDPLSEGKEIFNLDAERASPSMLFYHNEYNEYLNPDKEYGLINKGDKIIYGGIVVTGYTNNGYIAAATIYEYDYATDENYLSYEPSEYTYINNYSNDRLFSVGERINCSGYFRGYSEEDGHPIIDAYYVWKADMTY